MSPMAFAIIPRRPTISEELVQTRPGPVTLVHTSVSLVRHSSHTSEVTCQTWKTLLIGMIGFEHTWIYVTPCDSNNETFACGNPPPACAAGTLAGTSPIPTGQATGTIAAAPIPSTQLVSTAIIIQTETRIIAGTGVPTATRTITSSPSSAGVNGAQSYIISSQIALGCGLGLGLPATIAAAWLFVRYKK